MLNTGIFFGLIAILFWCPYMLAKGIESLNGELSIGKKLLCMIPFSNVIVAEKKYFGKVSLCLYSTIIFIIMLALRFYTLFFMLDNITVCTISVALLVMSVLVFLIANVRFVYVVIKDADVLSFGNLMLFSLIYPFGQYYIGAFLVKVLESNKRREETFK